MSSEDTMMILDMVHFRFKYIWCVAFQKIQPLPTSSRDHMELTKAVTYCLAKDMLHVPISTVEKMGFKAMLQHLIPWRQLPSRSYFNRVAIPAMVGEVAWHRAADTEWRALFFFLVPQKFGPQLLEIPTTIILILSERYNLLPTDTLHTSRPHRWNIKEALSATLLQWNLHQSRQVGITIVSGEICLWTFELEDNKLFWPQNLTWLLRRN